MNVMAGILIGVANTSWLAVLIASLIWPFVFCGYVFVAHGARREATLAVYREPGKRLWLGSPTTTFYGIEFATALLTALPVAVVTYGIKRLVT